VRVTIGKLLAATLLILCVGLQVLEATGGWDRTFQETGDEAVIVTVVLCIGAAVLVAGATRARIAASPLRGPVTTVNNGLPFPLTPVTSLSAACVSPPLRLRI
jgi:hypothetical protein